MQSCENCGSAVTPAFARVFGDNANVVYACPNCAVAREIYEGRTTGHLDGQLLSK